MNPLHANEIKPISGERNDRWSGIGTTIIDSLDTLWLISMNGEFDEARAWVLANELKYEINSFFYFCTIHCDYVDLFSCAILSLNVKILA